MTERQPERWIRPLALLAGLCTVGLAVSQWSFGSSVGPLGAEIRISAVPSGELSTSRLDPFLVGRALRPSGRAAEGSVKVKNVTATGRSVRVRALPSSKDLDRLLHVSLTAGKRRIFKGTLGRLRSWTSDSISLATGERVKLGVRAWLGRSVRHGYSGRIEDIQLEFHSGEPQ